ncbi:MAG: hypothetical protein U5K69_02725 [Balneolaceae bacterium]|nr:hypothetical protein [Balneolaceae bacterium]
MQDTTVLNSELASQPAINQALIAMLRGADIQAWPLLISSRQYGKINRSFPSYFQFNGLLAYSEINGKSYFMDGSFSHSYPNLLPVESFNETGLLLKKDSYEWTEIRPENSIFSHPNFYGYDPGYRGQSFGLYGNRAVWIPGADDPGKSSGWCSKERYYKGFNF